MQMQASWILTSKRFWGIAITAASTMVPLLSNYMGWDVDAEQVEQVGAAGAELISAVGMFVGLVLTFIGSMKAKGPMTLTSS